MSIERRLSQAEKAAAASHGDGQKCQILENPNFYGNADRLGWADIKPRILEDPSHYETIEPIILTDPDDDDTDEDCGQHKP